MKGDDTEENERNEDSNEFHDEYETNEIEENSDAVDEFIKKVLP